MIDDVDFSELWPAPLADAACRDFERSLADQLAATLAPQSDAARREQTSALKSQIRRPWEEGDLIRFIGTALALRRVRALKSYYAGWLASALLTQERFEEAGALFPMVEQDDHFRWWDEARALAGMRRIEEARKMIARCHELLTSAGDELDIVATLRTLERGPSRLDFAAGWLQWPRIVRRQIKGGQHAEAKATLQTFLVRRTQLFAEALRAVAEPVSHEWHQLRRQAGACLLLGLGEEAAERLAACTWLEIAIPDTSTDQAAHLFAIAAAAASSSLQRGLLEAFAGALGKTQGNTFARQAVSALSGDATAWDLEGATQAPVAVVAAVATMLAQAGARNVAIMLFGQLATSRSAGAQRRELAVCQSRQSVGQLHPKARVSEGRPRIFDLFPYNGEIEVLRIKLHEMGPWVDHFVLVESALTFSGNRKPLYFNEQVRHELAPFQDKIIYMVIDKFPEYINSPWSREFYQRDQAFTAIQSLCDPNDLVILSDADEILDGSRIGEIHCEITPVQMPLFQFFLNYRRTDREQFKTVVCRARQLECWSASLLRTVLSRRVDNWQISEAGWHFSSVGSAEDITRKLASYSHIEHNRSDNETRISEVIERFREGELDPRYERCDLSALPSYIARNRERLSHLLLS